MRSQRSSFSNSAVIALIIGVGSGLGTFVGDRRERVWINAELPAPADHAVHARSLSVQVPTGIIEPQALTARELGQIDVPATTLAARTLKPRPTEPGIGSS